MGSIGLPELIVLAVVIGFGYRLLRGGNIAVLAVLGALLGAFVGFLMRPSVPVFGQLDLYTVLSRGTDLTGINTLWRHTAEESCNYVLIGAIVGGSLFALVKLGRANVGQSVAATPGGGVSIPINNSGAVFCTKCGKQLDADVLFCGACGTKRK